MGIASVTFLKPIVSKIASWGSGGPADYPGPGEGTVKVTIKPGQNGEDIATTLKSAGVVKSRTAYLDAAAADPAAAGRVQPGTYVLRKQMRGVDAFAVVSNPANATDQGITLPEGLWSSEIYGKLSAATGVPLADYTAAAQDPGAIGLPAEAGGNVEGWLFPSTYQFPQGASAVTQLSTLVAKTRDELGKAGVPADQAQRILTIASIIEGEAGPADFGKVSRVIENRISNPTGPTAGFLQMDSTRNFALGKRGNLTAADVQKSAESPYDTYAHKGLPPGPIGNPGAHAIVAAANPPEGPWFYFVTINLDTGETLFATTLAEQEANVAQLTQWCAQNKPKCEGK